MRFIPLLLAGVLATPSLALGQASGTAQPVAQPVAAAQVAAAPAPATPAPAPAAEPSDPNFGLAITLGAPDGAVLSFTWSPLYWLLIDAGFAYTLAPGIVAGIEFRPIDFVVAPLLRGEYGYYFTGNTSDQIKKWAGIPQDQWGLLGPTSYNWWSGLVGIAIGSRRGFSAALEGGVGYLSLNAKGGTGTVNGNIQAATSDWSAKAFMPVARLSFLFFF